jgi:hypothetical protein
MGDRETDPKLVDAVASAIAMESTGTEMPVGWYNETSQEVLRKTARAAIAAVRDFDARSERLYGPGVHVVVDGTPV